MNQSDSRKEFNINLRGKKNSSKLCFKNRNVNEQNEKVTEILKKWLVLQKTIKEEVTLEHIISKQQDTNHQSLVNSYNDYYAAKLSTRQTFENVINIDNGNNDLVDFQLVSNVEKSFSDAYDPVKKLLFLLRSNYDYILKLVSIIDEAENLKKDSDSLVDLFCHQFYDNILIPNPEQEELLILCYLLLEKEVSNMNSASVSCFIDETQSFVGKFLKSYTKKQELKNYLSDTLGNLILKIENSDTSCLDLNPSKINNYLKNTAKNNINNSYYIKEKEAEVYPDKDLFTNEEFLTRLIPRCLINIDKDIYSQEEDDDSDDEDSEPRQNLRRLRKQSLDLQDYSHKISKKSYSDLVLNIRDTNDLSNDLDKDLGDPNINYDYSLDLTQEMLNDKIQSEDDPDLKEFYLRQLERINRDPDIFTNKKFLKSLSEYGNDQFKILQKYKDNFLYIKETIDKIIQSLIDKITTIPYTLRCICKIINILISKKFDKISTYEKNAFIGEFIFGKCILPILINSDINAIITSTIISNNTRQCLKNIAKVLTKINRGFFFEANSDTDFTIFNHYIIEVIPIINSFYQTLIDVQLPRVLGELVDEYIERPVPPRVSYIRKSRIEKEKLENGKEECKPTVSYNFFNENPEESVHIQCICFSIEDILLLVKIIRQKMDEFKNLPQFVFFQKTIDRIYNEEHKLALETKNSGKVRKFFLVFKEEKNAHIVYRKESVDTTLTADETDTGVILHRVKFCIKTILRGLNLINNKDYSYLNIANSSNNLFRALKYTTNTMNEESDFGAINKIPLKWYSQYMFNNKKTIPEEYRENDYEKLYSELLSEEESALDKLRSSSGILMTRNGMNMRCAEKIIENAKRDLLRIREIEKFMKMEKFINKTKIEVCIRDKDKNIDSENNNKKEKTAKIFSLFGNKENLKKQPVQNPVLNDEKEDELPSVMIFKITECVHQSLKNLSTTATTVAKFHPKDDKHPKNIKDFIKSITKFNQMRDDIYSGTQDNKCFNTFEQYLGIVKTYLYEDDIFKNDPEPEKLNMLERIEDHIMKRIYHSIFPSEALDIDTEFHNKTKLLSWVTPAHLEIKKIYESELKYAKDCVRKIDEGKSPYAKLYCIAAAHNTINNTIKFSSGKNADAGAEELSPIFQYIIIQAQPKRFFSNINYIKAFLHPSKLKGMYGFLLSQMEFSATFIMNINHTNLKISESEFNAKMEEARDKTVISSF